MEPASRTGAFFSRDDTYHPEYRKQKAPPEGMESPGSKSQEYVHVGETTGLAAVWRREGRSPQDCVSPGCFLGRAGTKLCLAQWAGLNCVEKGQRKFAWLGREEEG